MIRPQDRLIVALDVETLDQAKGLLKKLLPAGVSHFKIGSSLFTATGPEAVDAVHQAGGKVFLDLKFHDIPNTVASAIGSAARLKV